LIFFPYLYNSALVLLSGEMRSAWFAGYQETVTQLLTPIRQIWPVPAWAAAILFPGNEQFSNIFSGFSYIDVIAACLGFAVITGIVCCRIDSPVETFSAKYGRQPPRGSWILAVILLLITSGVAVHFHASIFRSGSLFAQALHHCARRGGIGGRHCIAYADNTPAETIRQLGWLLSLVPAAMILLCALTVRAWKAAWKKARFRPKPLA